MTNWMKETSYLTPDIHYPVVFLTQHREPESVFQQRLSTLGVVIQIGLETTKANWTEYVGYVEAKLDDITPADIQQRLLCGVLRVVDEPVNTITELALDALEELHAIVPGANPIRYLSNDDPMSPHAVWLVGATWSPELPPDIGVVQLQLQAHGFDVFMPEVAVAGTGNPSLLAFYVYTNGQTTSPEQLAGIIGARIVLVQSESFTKGTAADLAITGGAVWTELMELMRDFMDWSIDFGKFVTPGGDENDSPDLFDYLKWGAVVGGAGLAVWGGLKIYKEYKGTK